MLHIATLFLTVIVLYAIPGIGQKGQSAGPGTPVIDLAECKQETKVVYSKFGSERIVVKGRRGSRCVIERTSETEGSYVTRECRIPVSRGKIRLEEGAEASGGGGPEKCDDTASRWDVSKYCKVVKTGNVLLEGR